MDSQDVADAPLAIPDYAADISALPRLPVSTPNVSRADAYSDEAVPVGALVSMASGSVAPFPTIRPTHGICTSPTGGASARNYSPLYRWFLR